MEINLQLFIFALIDFLILLFVLYKFLYNPLLKMMDDRKKGIEDALNQADQARQEVASTQAVLQSEIDNAKNEARSLVNAAKQDAEKLKAEILQQAKEDAHIISEKAKEQIIREQKEAIADLKKEVATMAVTAAAHILQEEMTAEKQKNLTDKYIENIIHLQ
ncbi:MAG: F0F1 ATP synthase subunit B [Clostridiales bacterium]